MKPCFKLFIAVCIVFCTFYNVHAALAKRSFEIDYENDQFLKDGKPYRYISGAIHYFRVPPRLWKDRLLKMRAAGLNTIETYVEWRSHEPEPGVYNFKHGLDLVRFLKLAHRLGLLVILRPSPYIDAERDMGGLPYWLLRISKGIKLRTSDPRYLEYVNRWYSVLLPKIRPLLYQHGGPIITLQVENEYGSYKACDHAYMEYLVNLIKYHLENEVVLFTTDGPSDRMLTCGKAPGVFQTIDFGAGSNPEEMYKILRKHQPHGPLVNSEYYPGWFDTWGSEHSRVDGEVVAKSLDVLLAMNVSVNIYMFHGGTSYGYDSGAFSNPYSSTTTSYDYDAPLSEEGDTTLKYHLIRHVISKYNTVYPIPPNKPKMALPPQRMHPTYSLLDSYQNLEKVESEDPPTYAELSMPGGYLLYTKKIEDKLDGKSLQVPGIRDRGYVYINQTLIGILTRTKTSLNMSLNPNDTLMILVENQGRPCYGSHLDESKGIVEDVHVGEAILKDWITYKVKVPLRGTYTHKKAPIPGVYRTRINIPGNMKPKDTYLKLDGWGKGVAYLNGHSLGRYWPSVGPQQTLYAPAPLWKRHRNDLVLLEVERAPCGPSQNCSIELVNHRILGDQQYTGEITLYPAYHHKMKMLESHMDLVDLHLFV